MEGKQVLRLLQQRACHDLYNATKEAQAAWSPADAWQARSNMAGQHARPPVQHARWQAGWRHACMHVSPQQAKQLTVTPVVPSPISWSWLLLSSTSSLPICRAGKHRAGISIQLGLAGIGIQLGAAVRRRQ